MGVYLLQAIPEQFWNLGVGGLAQLLLSAVLAILYWQMRGIQDEQKDLQERQTEIMEAQTKLMSANHLPDLNHDKWDAANDQIRIMLKNMGNGPAKAPQVQCIIYRQVKDDKGEIRYLPGYQGEGTVVAPTFSPLHRDVVDNSGESYPTNEGPNKRVRADDWGWFVGHVKLQTESLGGEGRSDQFSYVMRELSQKWEVDVFAMDVGIAWTDIVGQQFSAIIGSWNNIPLEEQTFGDALHNGEPCEQIGEVLPEGAASPLMLIDPDDFEF
jgi:hypothetical protein